MVNAGRKLRTMRSFLNRVRKVTRFALAAALWLHALFVVRLPSSHLSGVVGRLHLTTSEAVVFALLITLSLLATYGYGRLVVDVLYVYFFPFVLVYIAAKWLFLGLVAINKFCAAGTSAEGQPALPA